MPQMDEQTIIIPAPSGGLNYAVPEFGMDPRFSQYMFNLIPENGQLRIRPAITTAITATDWTASVSAGDLRWLMRCQPYEPIIALTTKGHVASVSGSAGGFVTGAVFVGGNDVTDSMAFQFNNQLVYTMYPAYEPRTWNTGGDGTLAFTFPGAGAWSAMTEPLLTGGHPFKGRVYWWSYDSAADGAMAYTAVNATAGAVTVFPLKYVCQRGGYIVCITSLTMDGGSGADDLLAIMFSSGEVLVYQGSDPATDFELVGRFSMPPPIHCGAVARMGGDVVVLTKRGLFPLQQYIKSAFGLGEPEWMRRINPAIERVFGRLENPFGQVRYCENADLLYVILNDDTNGYCFEYRPRADFWGRNVIMKSTSARPAGTPADFELACQGARFFDCVEFQGTSDYRNYEVFFSAVAANSSGLDIRLLEYSAWNEAISDPTGEETPLFGSWTTPIMPHPVPQKNVSAALLLQINVSPVVSVCELYAEHDFRTALLEADGFASNTSNGYPSPLAGAPTVCTKLRIDTALFPSDNRASWYFHGLKLTFEPTVVRQPNR